MNLRLFCASAALCLFACGDDPVVFTDAGPVRVEDAADGRGDTDDDGGGRPSLDAGPDATPGDATPGDATAGDAAPGDAAPGDAIGVDADPDARPDAATDSAESDTGTPDVDEPDPCDRDRDGFTDRECGGDDCDDDDGRVRPDAREVCDYTDNNCSGANNEDIECEIYAHTADALYKIDPFLGTETYVTSVPNLFDFDTDTSGTLYGISSSTLYVFDEGASRWDSVGPLATTIGANGFAINSSSTAFATAGNELYTVNLLTGRATRVGAMGGPFTSSGDCVVDKDDQLYMTSGHATNDVLVRIDGRTGVATEVGNTGYPSIFGLTAAWGYLFGMSSQGHVLEIDPSTGAATLRHTFSGRRWYGAASAPAR